MYKLNSLLEYQFKLQLRNYMDMFFMIIFPVLMYIFFRNMLEGELFYDGSFQAIEYLLPAFIPIVIANSVLLVFGHLITSYKENKYFIKYKLMGYRSIDVAGILFFTVLLFQIIGTIVLIFTALIFGGISIPINNIFHIFLALVLINVFQFALVFFLSSFINKSSTYNSVALIIFFFQMFLGGMTLPVEAFPDGIRIISEIFNPVLHGVYILRNVWIMERSFFDFPLQIAIILGASLVFILTATKMFKWYDAA